MIPKTCSTCAHRYFGKCMRSGCYIEVERKYQLICGINFDGWVRRPGLLTRLCGWFVGYPNT